MTLQRLHKGHLSSFPVCQTNGENTPLTGHFRKLVADPRSVLAKSLTLCSPVKKFRATDVTLIILMPSMTTRDLLGLLLCQLFGQHQVQDDGEEGCRQQAGGEQD